jgi:hypothetical protein
LIVGDDEGRRESRGSRGKPRCFFLLGFGSRLLVIPDYQFFLSFFPNSTRIYPHSTRLVAEILPIYKAQVLFSAGLWLPLAPPLHQSASTADSRSCNDLPINSFFLSFFLSQLYPYLPSFDSSSCGDSAYILFLKIL